MVSPITATPRPAQSPASGPSLLARLRARRRRLALCNLVFMLCGLLGLALAPCQAMAGMQAGNAIHDCPDCPPAPCHDAQPAACPHESASDQTALPDLPRLDLPPALPAAELAPAVPVVVAAAPPLARYGPAPGRRSHLVFLRFNE
ncbi:MAG: hypothetical protein H6977_19340 [Gammaproteobacteria bacterium]|nr:hypothetical protein [Gammaproteobacteria bacterium]